jgi:hypothetical protein
MKSLTKEDLIPYAEYERIRESYRRRIIEVKRRRRLSVGDKITLLFENRDTIQFQIQEMVRVERIVDPAKVQEELDVYNAQLPADGELSATLFIEITESEDIQRGLDTLQGIDRGNAVALKAGPQTVFGEFERGWSKEDKISAVHFVSFRPTEDFVRALSDGSPLSIMINHPNYKKEVSVPESLRDEWMADLRLPDLI